MKKYKIFAGPVGRIPKVRNTIRKKEKRVRKFDVNSLARMECLRVKRRLDVLYVQHLVD